MIGITSLEVGKSIFNRIQENFKFERYTDVSDELSFTGLR